MKPRTIKIPENFPLHELARFANTHGCVLDYTNGNYSFVPYEAAIAKKQQRPALATVTNINSRRVPQFHTSNPPPSAA